jgi:hypothetical protein
MEEMEARELAQAWVGDDSFLHRTQDPVKGVVVLRL